MYVRSVSDKAGFRHSGVFRMTRKFFVGERKYFLFFFFFLKVIFLFRVEMSFLDRIILERKNRFGIAMKIQHAVDWDTRYNSPRTNTHTYPKIIPIFDASRLVCLRKYFGTRAFKRARRFRVADERADIYEAIQRIYDEQVEAYRRKRASPP